MLYPHKKYPYPLPQNQIHNLLHYVHLIKMQLIQNLINLKDLHLMQYLLFLFKIFPQIEILGQLGITFLFDEFIRGFIQRLILNYQALQRLLVGYNRIFGHYLLLINRICLTFNLFFFFFFVEFYFFFFFFLRFFLLCFNISYIYSYFIEFLIFILILFFFLF